MFKLRFLSILFFIVYSLTVGVVWSESGPPSLRLQFATFDPAEIDSLGIPQELMLRSYPPGAEGLYIAQFSGPLIAEQREALLDAGAEIIRYLPDYAYLAVMGDQALSRVSSWPMDGSWEAIWVGLYQPAFKIGPDVLQAGSGDDEWPTVIIQQFGESEEALRQLSEAVLESGANVEILSSSIWKVKQRLRVKVQRDDLYQFVTQVALRPNVVWIGKYYAPVLFNYNSRWICQSYVKCRTPVWDRGIHGEGQIVAVCDTGLDADMCFFYDQSHGLPNSSVNHGQRKTIVYQDFARTGDWDGYGHGSHVAGTIAGDNFKTRNEYDTGDGMAYSAKLVIQDVADGDRLIGLPPDLNGLFEQARDAGATLHSNSWGSSSTDYTAEAQDVDEFMWNNPTFLIFFSAGNSGPADHTVHSPATAKNTVSVGASQNVYWDGDPDNLAYFSSRGPAADDRIKPTVCAPGSFVYSADGDENVHSYNCSLVAYEGTSMSCPTVAGLAALVRQYYTDGFYPTGASNAGDACVPSGALLKATLINSGMNMTGNGTGGPLPSTGQGWGRVTLDDALHFAGDEGQLSVYDVSPGLSTGEADTYQVDCDGTFKLEVTLVWTDNPAWVGANPTLVNDLDLTVVAPDAVTYLGNNYSEGASEPGGSVDRLNPVECVQIDEPTSGTYQINVEAHNTPYGPQPYALVVTVARPRPPRGLTNGSVSPEAGGEATIFTYSVHYYDIYGEDPPSEKTVFVNDEPREMSLYSGEYYDGTYTFETTLPSGVNTYYFYFLDRSGKSYRLPKSGSYDGPVTDSSPPESTCWCDEYSSYPITVNFSASDAESAVQKTDLYYRYESGDWAFSGESEGGTAGHFAFGPPDGEGTYYFYTIATDVAGNVEDPPDTYDAETIHDAMAPSSSCSGPESAWGTFELSFAASDGDGCGLDRTCLWYKYEDGSWDQTGDPQGGDSGTFSFTTEHEDGSYFFYTIAADVAGNEEDAPSEPDCEVLIQRLKPKSYCAAPSASNQRDISIEFVVTETQASVESVRLWHKYEEEPWRDTGQDETGEAGAFEYHISGDEGRYCFYTIATDCVGMVEDPPDSPDTSLIFDATRPNSSCVSPACAPTEKIPVGFSASDAGSDIATTRLWVKFEDGDWENTGLFEQGPAGKFDFVGTQSEGQHYFYTVSEDTAGNFEEPPDNYDSDTLVDSSFPSSVCRSPQAASTTFTVTFEAHDEGCGVNLTSLFWRVQDGEWVLFGRPLGGETGVFDFEPSQGELPYEFYTITLDLAGNAEAPPATADTVTVFDTACASSSCNCPGYSTLASIMVEFCASDDGSGVSLTSLWYRAGDSEFVDSGLAMTGDSSVFEFVATDGEGTYEFYTIAIDRAANPEGPPVTPDASCLLDQTAPRSSCASPGLANVSPLAVLFASEDALSGVSHTKLFFKFEDGEWGHSGLVETGDRRQFSFAPPYGTGTYYFATVCLDRAGNLEDLPQEPDCSILFDETIPVSSCSSPTTATDASILVSYAANGGTSGLTGVELWYIFDGGGPQDSGLWATEPQGAFEFEADMGDGLYAFFTIALNNDDMRESLPASPDCITLLDSEAPTTRCDSPQYASVASVAVAFWSEDEHSDIALVELYYRIASGSWRLFNSFHGITTGTLSFGFPGPEGTYDFAFAAADTSGNAEAMPTGPCSTTVYDITPPDVTVSALEWTSQSTLAIDYVATDAAAGVAQVVLWYRFDEEGWLRSSVMSTEGNGTLQFEFGDGQGSYNFWVKASDFALNSTGEPQAAQASAVYDAGPPSSACYAPEYATSSPITVSFEAQDALCDRLFTELFYRMNDGHWQAMAQAKEGLAGEFALEAAVDGRYEFYSISTDLAGNSEPDTHKKSAARAAVLDTVPPSSSCVAPGVWTDPSVTIAFASSDETSGVHRTVLWARFEDGAWEDTGLSAEGEAGEFGFTLDRGEGTYAFYTVSEDWASNAETKGAADASMIYDMTAPGSSCCGPEYATGEFEVTFNTNESGSGIESVSLHYKFGGSAWRDTGLIAGEASGTFTFVPEDGDGAYSFATRALDLAGNQQGLPTRAGCTTVVDTQPPTSAANCCQLTNQRQVKITFDACDATSGLARVDLHYSYEDSRFAPTGHSSDSTSGSFEFDLKGADGTYSFYTIATDNAGLSQEAPAEAHCSVLLDTTPPISSCESPGSTQNPSVEISFAASDESSGIAETSVLYRLSGLETWLDAGLSSPAAEGTLEFQFPDGGGMYEFRTVALDRAGNTEPPGDDPCCATFYRTGYPDLFVCVDSHDFGAVAFGDIRAWEINLANTGKTDLVVESVETSGQPYSVGGPDSFTLGPGKQIGLNLIYSPTSDLAVDGELIIRSNDPDTPKRTVVLSSLVSQNDRPFLTVITDRPEYHEADTIRIIYALGNPGNGVFVDAYAAVKFPDDPTLYFLMGLTDTPTPVSLFLPQEAYVTPTVLLDYEIDSPIPEGNYVIYAALCRPATHFEFLSELSVARFRYK